MIRTPVSSSDLRSVGYESTTFTLEIEFVSGGIYQYDGVPVTIYQGLMNAPSAGRYFHARIKNSYPARKVG